MSAARMGRPPLSDEHDTVRLTVRLPLDLMSELEERMRAEDANYSQLVRDGLELLLRPRPGHLVCNCPDCKRPDHEPLT